MRTFIMDRILLVLVILCLIHISSQRICGDKSLCDCRSNLVICDSGLSSSNVFDILPETVLNSVDRLIINTKYCEDYKGLQVLLSTYRITLEVPIQCEDILLVDDDPLNMSDFVKKSDDNMDKPIIYYIDGPGGIAGLCILGLVIFVGIICWVGKKYRILLKWCRKM